jgi:hypothetical protein
MVSTAPCASLKIEGPLSPPTSPSYSRNSSELLPATTCLLRRRALSSRPASVTSPPPCAVGEPPSFSPCPAGRPCHRGARHEDQPQVRPSPRRHTPRRRRRADRSDRARRTTRDRADLAGSPVGWATSAAFDPPGVVGRQAAALWLWARRGQFLSIFENCFDIKKILEIGRKLLKYIENCRNARKCKLIFL